jgi:hypothetical protein
MVCFGSFVCSTNSTPLSTQQDVLSGLTICTIHNNQTTINIFTHSKQLGLLPCAKRQNCPLRLRWIPTNISDKVPNSFCHYRTTRSTSSNLFSLDVWRYLPKNLQSPLQTLTRAHPPVQALKHSKFQVFFSSKDNPSNHATLNPIYECITTLNSNAKKERIYVQRRRLPKQENKHNDCASEGREGAWRVSVRGSRRGEDPGPSWRGEERREGRRRMRGGGRREGGRGDGGCCCPLLGPWGARILSLPERRKQQHICCTVAPMLPVNRYRSR